MSLGKDEAIAIRIVQRRNAQNTVIQAREYVSDRQGGADMTYVSSLRLFEDNLPNLLRKHSY